MKNKTKKIFYGSLTALTLSSLLLIPMISSTNESNNLNSSIEQNSSTSTSFNSTNSLSSVYNMNNLSNVSLNENNWANGGKINYINGSLYLDGEDSSFAFIDKDNDKETDEIWGWGAGTAGQMGNGALNNQLTPLLLASDSTATNGAWESTMLNSATDEIIYMASNTLGTQIAFVSTDGMNDTYEEIWGWGYQDAGTGLGIGQFTNVTTPILLYSVGGTTNWNTTMLTDGDETILGIYSHGTTWFTFIDTNGDTNYDEIWGWGTNSAGALAINNWQNRPLPVPLYSDDIFFVDPWESSGMLNIGNKIVGFHGTNSTIYAFVDSTNDGIYDEIWTWGFNGAGNYGNGTSNANGTGPTSINNIMYGKDNLTTSGSWATNSQMLNNPNDTILSFVNTSNTTFTYIDTNNDNQYDEIWGWGNGTYSQLGNSSTTSVNSSPIKLYANDGSTSTSYWITSGMLDATNDKIIAHKVFVDSSIVFVSTDGDNSTYEEIWGWGYNNCQFGDGTQFGNNKLIPVNLTSIWKTNSGMIDNPNDVIIDLKNFTELVPVAFVSTDGNNSTYEEIWSWGQNNGGQLANGTTANALTPTKVNMTWAGTITWTTGIDSTSYEAIDNGNATTTLSFDLTSVPSATGMLIPGLDYGTYPTISTDLTYTLDKGATGGTILAADLVVGTNEIVLTPQANNIKPNTTYTITFSMNGLEIGATTFTTSDIDALDATISYTTNSVTINHTINQTTVSSTSDTAMYSYSTDGGTTWTDWTALDTDGSTTILGFNPGDELMIQTAMQTTLEANPIRYDVASHRTIILKQSVEGAKLTSTADGFNLEFTYNGAGTTKDTGLYLKVSSSTPVTSTNSTIPLDIWIDLTNPANELGFVLTEGLNQVSITGLDDNTSYIIELATSIDGTGTPIVIEGTTNGLFTTIDVVEDASNTSMIIVLVIIIVAAILLGLLIWYLVKRNKNSKIPALPIETEMI